MSKLVIDGDVLLYRFAWKHQFTVRWDENTKSEVITSFVQARDDLDRFVRIIQRGCPCDTDELLIALSHPLDFRFKVASTYQNKRKDKEPPVFKKQLLEYVGDNYECLMLPWLEADDVLGLQATEEKDVIIATIDKDLCQIPGRLYNWDTKRLITIDPQEADLFFFKQCLTGDSTDGIVGIPKVGSAKAAAYLEDWLDQPSDKIWAHVLEVYESHGLTPEYAIQQARLVRILRKGEYSYSKKEPILWKGYQ